MEKIKRTPPPKIKNQKQGCRSDERAVAEFVVERTKNFHITTRSARALVFRSAILEKGSSMVK
jgi:hypothetical protein